MPVKSQKQRAFLNWKFGHAWVKKHHFDQRGKLPERVARNRSAAKKALRRTKR